jgi:AcrR family transcriptional regulator
VSPNVKGSDARRDRWSDHRARRRREFVDAALRVLEVQGPDLPMDAVAAEAGVTKPVLYRYFQDKSALVDALGERGSEILLNRLLPAIQAGCPALSRVRDAVGAYFAVIDEHPNLYWLLAREGKSAGGPDSIQENKEHIATALTTVLGDHMRAYGLDSGAAEPWAYGMTGLVQSTGEWWLQRRSMSRATVAEYVTQIIWAAITGMLREVGITVDPDEPFPETRSPLYAVPPTDARLAPG